MRIHYNNGENEKIIDNVLSIQVIDGNQPVTVLMANGKELNVSLRNIEMILDETIFEKPKPETNFDRIAESAESLAEIMDNYSWCPYFSNSTCDREIECIECIKEWLQKEADDGI